MANEWPEGSQSQNVDRPGGVVIIPGSNYQRELGRFEQFPSKYTGDEGPGNPYRYRPFPKMVYIAKKYKGKLVCMAAPPHPLEFVNPKEYERVEEQAAQFTKECQRVVNDESEYQKAMEAGYRESPVEAVEHAEKREEKKADAAAERNWDDRNMSDKAKAETRKAEEAAGAEHLGEIPRTPVKAQGVRIKVNGWTPEKRAAASAKRKQTLAAKRAAQTA
jgi:hypothetical protein